LFNCLGLAAATGICLPSFYLLLAGAETSMLGVLAHALKGKSVAAVTLVGRSAGLSGRRVGGDAGQARRGETQAGYAHRAQQGGHARHRLQAAGGRLEFRSDAFTRFNRMREHVEQAEAEADALAELHAGADEPVAVMFQSREDDLCVEADLREIKERLVGRSP